MAMASTMTMNFTLPQIPRQLSVRNCSECVAIKARFGSVASLNFRSPKPFLSSSPPQRRDDTLNKLVCEADSGFEASVADSTDAVSVKKYEVAVESQDSERVQVRVDLPGEETQRMFDLVLTNLARTAPPIPGFRREKGGKTTKVPKTYLLGILGEERVTRFVMEDIVNSSMGQYVKKENLSVKENKVNTTQSAEELKSSFKPGKAFGFNVIIELQNPEAEEAAGSAESTVEVSSTVEV